MRFVCSEPRPGRCCLHLKKQNFMSGFTPFKKHANKFNYLPRYYDPEKEERDRRRAELRGERAEDAGKEYKPGSISVRKARPGRPAAAKRCREAPAVCG